MIEREKKTFSGNLLDIDFYPVWESGKPVRTGKASRTSPEMAKYNRIIANKKLIRLINSNFGEDDYFAAVTYNPANAPESEDGARRDINNYFRRIKTLRMRRLSQAKARINQLYKKGLCSSDPEIAQLKKDIKKLSQPMKYIYTIETVEYKRPRADGRTQNFHFHLFITGGLTAKEMKAKWNKGARLSFDNYEPGIFGPEAAALYMLKDPRGRKSFAYSKNLSKPKIRVRDGKISRAAVNKMALMRCDDREYFEKRYPGYRFLRCYSRFNPYNCQWYVSVVMYRTAGKTPSWTVEEWGCDDYV